MDFKGIIPTAKSFAKKHAPEIMLGIGITGFITTAILSATGTIKALDKIEQAKDELGVDELTKKETIKAAWTCYIPAVATAAASTACLIGGARVSSKRNAALAVAYSLSEKALTEYKTAIVETLGEKKAKNVIEAVDDKLMQDNPLTKNEVIITEKGNTLCYDKLNDRYFKADMDSIKRAENKINCQMLREGYVSLNDFYDEVGLKHTALGGSLGWKVDDGMIDISFSTCLADDGTPCLVYRFSREPGPGFDMYA